MYDIYTSFPYLFNKYKFHIIISDQLHISTIDTVVKYIKKQKDIDELILLGYSAGGVYMSNIMSLCKNINCKQKLITYDASHCQHKMMKNIIVKDYDQFERELCKFYIDQLYGGPYNWNNVVNSMCKYYNITHKEFIKRSSFNYDLNENLIYYNIYEKLDPFIKDHHLHSINKYKHLINFKIKNFEKNNFDHCTDMFLVKNI